MVCNLREILTCYTLGKLNVQGNFMNYEQRDRKPFKCVLTNNSSIC